MIKTPVFIIGMPRTGSTRLHNLLFSDQERFTSMKLWEILFCPSVIQKMLVKKISSSEKIHTSGIMKKLRNWDTIISRNYRPMHPTGLFQIEEDGIQFVHIFSGFIFLFLFPTIRRFNNLVFFEESCPPKMKKRSMSFLKMCIQKHLFVFGDGRIYLSKCPSHTPKIRSIRDAFPGSRFICLFRNPEEVIPSTISMLTRYCKIYNTPLDDSRIRDWTLRMADHWYTYPVGQLQLLPHENYITIHYTELIRNPDFPVNDIYSRFGFPMNNSFRMKLQEEGQKFLNYKSDHTYSPEQFGMEADEINTRYGKAFNELIKFSNDDRRQKTPLPVSMVENR